MEVVGAAAAVGAASAGAGLFSYNRGNYMMDAKNRYTRFTSGLNMAIAQTGMYRQDITDLTTLTVTRMDVYHVVAAMGLTILTAIYCPGRLGLHTPPPPGWLMGLEFVNIGGAYMFLGLTVWLCMHAAARADTAGTHLLTRFVRLPIPSQAMLDKARKFCASYEEQPLSEIFRIPFFPHRESGDDPLNDYQTDGDAKRRTRSGLDVPTWYRVEKEVGRHSTVDSITDSEKMPLAGKGDAGVPEHFEAYRELQAEWFPYDVYSRLSVFLAFMHMTSAWTFLQIGHQITEIRALFACVLVVLQMFSLQQIILTLDICPMSFPLHRIGPFALWFAYFGMAIEYKRWFTPGAQLLGFVFAFCAYAIQIVYTLWLLKICAPSKNPPDVSEAPGAAWWPKEWALPTSFQHAIWLVAPPRHLEKGQVDIVSELRDAQRGESPSRPRRESSQSAHREDVLNALGKHGESAAWWNVRTGLQAMVIAWVWMTAGFAVEVMYQGTATPSFLNAPGMPNNARDPRYRKPKVGHHEPTEIGTGGLHGPARGVHMSKAHRRLSELQLSPETLAAVADQPEVAQALEDLMPHLYELVHSGGGHDAAAAPPAMQAPMAVMEPKHLQVNWPALFEPHFLASHPHQPVALALSRHGSGSVIAVPQSPEAVAAEPSSFVLEGVATQGPLAAASWDSDGLLLMTATGVTLECPGDGPTPQGRWRCTPLPGAKLPISVGGSTSASRVAVARAGSQGLRAAVIFPGDDSVTVFSRASRAAASWLPSGEVAISTPTAVPSFTTGAESLLLTAGDGSVTHLHMGTGHFSRGAAPVSSSGERIWPASCRLSTGGLVRLSREADMTAELVLS